MKIKSIFIVLFLFVAIFSQSISYWETGENYKQFDIVYLDGIRYIANKNGVNSMPTQSGNDDWYRIVPLRFPLKPERQSRLFPIGHWRVKNQLLEDDFVKKVLDLCNYNLDFIDEAGIFREKDIVGEILHSSWASFMVTDSVDWHNTNSNHWNALKNPSDDYRHKVITRKYNDYKNLSNDPKKGGYTFVEFFVSEGQKGAYEQIIHNIGDAGVPYSHALSNFFKSTGSEEEEYELYVGTGLAGNYWDTYFTGSIYDAISMYGVRTLETLEYKKNNSIGTHHLASGNKESNDKVWGVMRNAFSVGRFILVDAVLTNLPLLHQEIKGEPFVKPNELHTLTAYAKDPDAVLFLHRDKKQGTKWTNSSELLIDSIFTDYQLWYEQSAHPIIYEWDLNNSGKYENLSPNGNITFTVEIPQGLTLDSLKLIDNKERGVTLKTNGKNYTVKVKNTCFTIAAKITDDEDSSVIVKKQLTFFNAIPIAEAEIKKGGAKTPYMVKVKRSNIYSGADDDKYYYQKGITADANGIKILSGFTNPESYEKVYIDFFKKSYDPDGNASDQIISTEFGFNNNGTENNYKWDTIKGVNQYIDTTYSFIKDNKEQKIPEQRIVINNTFWLESKDNDTIMSYLDQYFLSSVWENNSSPVTKQSSYPDIIPSEDYKLRVKIWDNEEIYLEEDTLKLPILTPPEIKRVELSTVSLISQEIREIYKNDPIVLYSGDNMVLRFYAEAYDPDNGKNAKDGLSGIKSYAWSIREKITGEEVDFFDVDFSNNDLEKQSLTFNHKELRELLGPNFMKLGNTYEVFLKVEDDDGDIGERIIENGCGFAITKVGEFILDDEEDY